MSKVHETRCNTSTPVVCIDAFKPLSYLAFRSKQRLLKWLLVALMLPAVQHQLNAQACVPAVSAPTLSATTAPLICPALTADLTSLVSSTAPSGMALEWHSVASAPSAANVVTMPVATAGNYYAYWYNASLNCYSAASVAVSVTNTAIASPAATTVNNTLCSGANGSITFTGPTPLSNYEFAIDGGGFYQSSPTFTGLAAGSYNIIVRSLSTACESGTVLKTISSTPAAVTAPTATTINVTNCNANNGSITITGPTPLANYQFSIDGLNFQPNATFGALDGGSYNVIAQSVATGCNSAPTVKVLTTPVVAAPTTTLVQPTSCITGNGSITFTAPTPATNYMYSIDGGATYQSSTTFTGLTAGTYNTRVKLISSGCESAKVAKILTNPVVTTPTATTVNNTSCLAGNGSITVTGIALVGDYQYSINNGDTYQSSPTFTGLNAGTYSVVIKKTTSGCVCVALPKTITDAPAVIAAPTSTLSMPTNCTTPNGVITITGPLPLSDYQFSINGGATFQSGATFSNLAAGSYSTVTKSNLTGCLSAPSVKVLTNPLITVPTVTQVNNTSCISSNGSLTITAPTPLTDYSFSNNDGVTFQTSPVFNNLVAGAYGVVIKLLSTGCTSVSSVKTITDAPVAVTAPTSTVVNVTNCAVPNGSITITAPTPLTNYQFSIDGGTTFQTSNVFSGLGIGSYNVVSKLISTGCVSPLSVKTITGPTVTAPTATAVNNTSCSNPNGSITITAPTPLANYQFSKDGGLTFQTSQTFTGLTAGTYDLVAQVILSGCVSTIAQKVVSDAVVAVTAPTSTTVNPTTCSPGNGSITFTGPTPLANYQFSINGGLTYQSGTSFTALTPGTYNTRVKLNSTGCESPVIAKVLSSPSIAAPTATGVNNTSCGITPNGMITINTPTPFANYTFSIDGGTTYQASNVFTGLTAGTYTLYAKLNVSGCMSSTAGSVTLTNAQAAIAAPASTTVNVTNCGTPNGSITFTSPTPLANYEFSIDGGTTYQTSANFTGLSAGTYSLYARSIGLHCVSAMSSKILTAPTVTAPNATTVNLTNCTTPNGAINFTTPSPTSSYSFSINNGTTFQTSPNFTGLAAGTYTLIAKKNSSGCPSPAVTKIVGKPNVATPTASVISNSTCLTPNGEITFTGPSPSGSYLYSVNNGTSFQAGKTFTGLAPATYSIMVQSVATGCTSTAVAKIVANSSPAVTAPVSTVVNNTNCTTTNGSITFTSPIPLANYKFSIDSGATFQTSNVFSGLNGTSYVTMVKSNATGCTSPAVIKTLTNPVIPTPTASITHVTNCATPNGVITLNTPAPVSAYQFSKDGGVTFQASASFTGLAAGTYSIVAKQNSSGCKSSAYIATVNNPTLAAPTATITNVTDCITPNGKIVFSGPSPLTSYLFSIDSGATYQAGITRTGLTAGTYYLRAKSSSSGCPSNATTVTVSNPAVPAPSVTVTNVTNCNNMNGMLTITAPSPLSNYSFSIDSGATFSNSSLFQNLSAGVYYVKSKLNSSGCISNTTTSTISNPVIAAAVPTSLGIHNICPSATANLQSIQPVPAVNTVLEWHTSTNPSGANLVATPTSVSVPQNYYLYAKSTVSGCYSPASGVSFIQNDCADTDGDSVPDYVDIDDDNDGVTDMAESVACSPHFWSYANFVISGNKYSGDLLSDGVKVADVSFEIPGSQAGYSVQPVGTTQSTTRVTFVTLQSVTGGDHYYQIIIKPLPGQTIKSPFRVVAPGYAPVWVNHPGQHYAVFGNNLNGSPTTAVFTEVYEHITEVNGITTYYSGEHLTNPAFAPDGAGLYDLLIEADHAHPYVWEYHQVDIYNNSFINERVNIDVPQCYSDATADSDGDGIPNAKDLDSDGDGCSDAFESGLTTSQTPNYKFTGTVGANGYMNYLETSLDNGTPVISPTYNNAVNTSIHACVLPCNAGTVAPSVPASQQVPCPATTIDLGTIAASNMPVTSGNVIITWHSSTPATDANKLNAAQVAAAPAGTYYAAFYDVNNHCYSGVGFNGTATTVVTITPCAPCLAGTSAPVLNGSTMLNSCPVESVNLNTKVTSTTPVGASLVWFNNNAHTGTAYATPTLAGAGTYYAFYFDSVGNCYSPPSTAVTVTIATCCNVGNNIPLLIKN